MATKKTENTLAKLDKAGLEKELASLRKGLYLLQMKHAMGELKETHLVSVERKKIARTLTYLNRAI